jgi:formyl-CoA transferase
LFPLSGLTTSCYGSRIVASVPQGPLQGFRVLELGTLIAGPFAGRLLAEAGAESGEEIMLPGHTPKLSKTPLSTRWTGPRLGAHTSEVLRELGYDEARERSLRDNGVIA